MNRKVWLVGIGIVVIALVVIGMALNESRKPSFIGTVYNPALPAPDIKLIDHNGNPFELSSLRGKIVLIYFGYTNCPDECPLTLAKLKETFDMLNEKGDNVQVLLISTDPLRDTPEKLKSYLANFHPSFLGLTGSPEELQKVYGAYGVTMLDNGETHTNRIYVIDHSGNLRLTMMYETSSSDIASDLKVLLKEE